VFLLDAEDSAGTALLYMRFEIVIVSTSSDVCFGPKSGRISSSSTLGRPASADNSPNRKSRTRNNRPALV
jgi:hypothetical protein